jgi:hypothetical protein
MKGISREISQWEDKRLRNEMTLASLRHQVLSVGSVGVCLCVCVCGPTPYAYWCEYASELTATKTIHVSIYEISIWKGWTTEKAGQMDIRLPAEAFWEQLDLENPRFCHWFFGSMSQAAAKSCSVGRTSRSTIPCGCATTLALSVRTPRCVQIETGVVQGQYE